MKSYSGYKCLRRVGNNIDYNNNKYYSIEIVAKKSNIGRIFSERDVVLFHYYKKGCNIYRFIHNSVFFIYNSNRYVALVPNSVLMSETL